MTSTISYGSFPLLRVEKTISITFLQRFLNCMQIGFSMPMGVQLKNTKGLCGGGGEFKISLSYVRTIV